MTVQELMRRWQGMDIDDFEVTTFDPETGESEPVTGFYVKPENKTVDLDTERDR